MDKKIVKYQHHATEVSVMEGAKGRHRDFCLCYNNCKRFKPEDAEKHCNIATSVFLTAQVFKIVTPVWECPRYAPEDNEG